MFTRSDLDKLVYEYATSNDITTLRQEVANKGSYGGKLMKAMRRWNDAYYASHKFGLIGVGSISFAEHRLDKYARKVGLV